MKLPKGLYEQLITREIAAALDVMDLDALRVEQAPLDPVDSYDILARHVYAVLNRVLRALPEGDRLASKSTCVIEFSNCWPRE